MLSKSTLQKKNLVTARERINFDVSFSMQPAWLGASRFRDAHT